MMATNIPPFLLLSQFRTNVQTNQCLAQIAGFALPRRVDERSILTWYNQRCTMLQSEDPMIVDIREMEDETEADAKLSYLPDVFAITCDVFDVFCEFFDIPTDLKAKLCRIDPRQSVVMVKNRITCRIMVWPYFINVNYCHRSVTPQTTLGTLMWFQDQAVMLNVPSYPLDNDVNTQEDYYRLYLNQSSSFGSIITTDTEEATPSPSLKRQRSEDEDDDEEENADPMNVPSDEDDMIDPTIKKRFRAAIQGDDTCHLGDV